MLDRFRRLSQSKIGVGILVAIGVVILASFALADVNKFKSGTIGGGDSLVKVGDREVTSRDVDQAMEQLLGRARQENPTATYQDLSGEFDPLVESLVRAQALTTFGEDNGLNLSKRLFDAEIAKLPQTRGLDGKFSDAAYQSFLAKQRLTDAELRRLLSGSLAQRLLLTPAAANGRIATGLATPYASMLMEARDGEIGLVPVAAFAAGLKPSDAALAAYYNANKARYTEPEQRTLRIARFGGANAAVAPPSDQDVAAYYKANQASYAAKEVRTISQAVMQDKAAADGIAARAKGGAAFAAAAQPAGLSAQDVGVGPQTRAQYVDLAGEAVAAAVFAPAVKAGTVVGPIHSDLGWHVVRVEAIKNDPGKSPAEARAEIVAKLSADKRKAGLGDLYNRVQTALDDGHNFADVVAQNGLTASETPLVTAQGTSLADPGFKLPPELAGALKSGFDLTPQDPPVIETLPGDAGFALVALGRQQPAAPSPLARIRAQVERDWITVQAATRARAAATAIAAKATAGGSLADAMKTAGVALPAVQKVSARRLQIEQAPPATAAALRLLFSLTEGKSRVAPVPASQAFAVVKAIKITPGNAVALPSLISRVQGQFQQGASEEYAREFLNAVAGKVGVVRNDAALAATRQRVTGAVGSAP